jgi:hypothetical protein
MRNKPGKEWDIKLQKGGGGGQFLNYNGKEEIKKVQEN